MKKDLNDKRVIIVILSFIVILFLVAFNNYQISLAIEQDSSIIDSYNMASLVNASIANANYYTITNATTPSVITDDRTGNSYVVYFRGENNGANVYIQRSNDNGKTFSDPVRINDIEDSVQLDAQWSPPAVGIGTNSELYVV
jgi:YbbR domain-containing protein